MANNQEDLDVSQKRAIELGQDLEWCKTQPQFQRLIMDGYIKDVLLRQSQYMISMDPATRQMTSEQIMSVNYFRDYLVGVANSAEVDDE